MLNTIEIVTLADENTLAGANFIVEKNVGKCPNLISILLGKEIPLTLRPDERELGKCLNLSRVKFVGLKNLKDTTSTAIL